MELVFNQMLGECAHNVKIRRQAVQVSEIIWINQRISECVRYGAATGLV
jgi:hypothetical protein